MTKWIHKKNFAVNPVKSTSGKWIKRKEYWFVKKGPEYYIFTEYEYLTWLLNVKQHASPK